MWRGLCQVQRITPEFYYVAICAIASPPPNSNHYFTAAVGLEGTWPVGGRMSFLIKYWKAGSGRARIDNQIDQEGSY